VEEMEMKVDNDASVFLSHSTVGEETTRKTMSPEGQVIPSAATLFYRVLYESDD